MTEKIEKAILEHILKHIYSSSLLPTHSLDFVIIDSYLLTPDNDMQILPSDSTRSLYFLSNFGRF